MKFILEIETNVSQIEVAYVLAELLVNQTFWNHVGEVKGVKYRARYIEEHHGDMEGKMMKTNERLKQLDAVISEAQRLSADFPDAGYLETINGLRAQLFEDIAFFQNQLESHKEHHQVVEATLNKCNLASCNTCGRECNE